jgi:hypothetical protein
MQNKTLPQEPKNTTPYQSMHPMPISMSFALSIGTNANAILYPSHKCNLQFPDPLLKLSLITLNVIQKNPVQG